MSDAIGWMLERWPFAVVVIGLFALVFGGMAFGWGYDVIRPVSAQTMQAQITAAKAETASSIAGIQAQLKTISETQGTIQKTQHDDHLARVEQQLLWWRQQNCKSKGTARKYAYDKMDDLKKVYRDLVGTDWQMPTCSDIGE